MIPGAEAPIRARLLGAALGLPAAAILGLAAWFDPDPAGHGTHVQLGLRPCSVLTWTGYPCPMCGMTTSFAAMMDLDPVGAVVAQPFGIVLFALTAIAAGLGLVEIVHPIGRIKAVLGWLGRWEGWAAGTFVLGLTLGWLYKIWQMWPV